MKKLLLLLLVMLMALPIAARNFSYSWKGVSLTYTVLDEDAKTVEVATEQSVTGDLIIPTKVSDGANIYTVTSIRYEAFAGCTGLTSVTIPESVTSIGTSAFEECTGLTKAEFASIDALCKIKFVNGYSNPLTCAEHLFINGEEVKDLVIPESVTSIGGSAFMHCAGLISVTIPESVTSIGVGAFCDCIGLTKAEFASIDALCKIEFGNDSNPLYAAHHLFINGEEVKDLVIPESVTSIGYYAFVGCTGLTSVAIPGSVTEIGDSAFAGCTGLTSVTIPESVTSIGNAAFVGCTGLTSVTIPGSVTSIGYYAFFGCTGLTSVTIPGSVTSIGTDAFGECTGLTSVTIPGSVTSFGIGAFWRCTGLISVTILEGVTSIDSYAFDGCTGLTSVTIPGSVTSIGWAAFRGCTGLTSVYYSADKLISCKSDTFDQSTYDTATLYLTENAVIFAGAIEPWKYFKNIEEFEFSGIGNIATDIDNYETIYYNLNGVRVNGDALIPGIYIKRQGSKSEKVLVK